MDTRSLSVALAITLWSPLALAQHRDHHHRDESDNAAIREAIELRRRHRDEEALAAFQRIYQETLEAEALGEIAQTELIMGRYAAAEDHLTEALGSATDPWVARSRRQLETWLEEARTHLATLTITGTPLGATVKINQRLVGRLPLEAPLRLITGNVLLEVEAPGYLPFVRSLDLQPGTTHTERAALRREFADTAPPVGAVPTSASACQAGMELRNGLCYSLNPPPTGLMSVQATRAILWTGVAVTTVSAALALGLWLDGNSTEREYLADCGGASVSPSCDARWMSDQSSLSGRAALVNVLWVTSVLGVGAAIVGAVLAPRAPRAERVSLHGAQLRVVW